MQKRFRLVAPKCTNRTLCSCSGCRTALVLCRRRILELDNNYCACQKFSMEKSNYSKYWKQRCNQIQNKDIKPSFLRNDLIFQKSGNMNTHQIQEWKKNGWPSLSSLESFSSELTLEARAKDKVELIAKVWIKSSMQRIEKRLCLMCRQLFIP